MPHSKELYDVSFIVSTFNRPDQLQICLRSLLLQNVKKEILVADNAGNARNIIKKISKDIRYFDTSGVCIGCYDSANFLSLRANGRFLCFPSDDGYYVPSFARKLLRFAYRFKLDLVYCDFINDDRYIGQYEVIRAQPIIGHIDKGGFLIRRKIFPGFPDQSLESNRIFGDGVFIESIRTNKLPHGKLSDVLWVHN